MELSDYLEELKQIKVLAMPEETRLWSCYKDANDQAARQILIESYQPLVFKAAAGFKAANNIMDIIQEGTVGLIEAVENYDHQRGVAFSLYALHRIRGRMLNFMRKEGLQNLTYIDNPMYNRESDGSVNEYLIDDASSVAEQVEEKFLVGELKAALSKLPHKEQLVLNGVYLQDREAKHMARQLDVTTSHVYRLQKQGIRRIRGIMAKLMHHW